MISDILKPRLIPLIPMIYGSFIHAGSSPAKI